ncbi:MAG: lamin tail domain-containing protein [Kiritimatiellae bacterium]|nr:lamin tail domain-containing protein [Kiritimatiellia bacterium]
MKKAPSLLQPRYFAHAAAIVLGVSAAAQVPTTGVFREVFTDLAGSSVWNLTNMPVYPLGPTLEGFLPHFESPTNWADNYGQRLRALLLPPTSGLYRFAIASDDASVLYLSPTTNEAQKIPIASVSGWTNFRQFDKETNQWSSLISLTNGFAYYIEAIQKEGTGGDNLTVMWVRPGGVTNIPIPGAVLRPVGMTPPVITSQPPASLVMMAGDQSEFAVAVSRQLNTGYRWQRNETDIPGATFSSYWFGPVSPTNNQDRLRCIVTNLHGATTTRTCVVTVVPDNVPPTITASRMVGPRHIEIWFSEPVNVDSATWVVEGGTPTTVRQSGDRRSVLIALAAPAPTGVTVRVSGVRDLAEPPNTIAANTPAASVFGPGPTPLELLLGGREIAGPSSRRTPIAITEIHYNPPDRADGRDVEFIELYNSVEWPWDISGYRLGGEISFTFPPGTVISGRSYRVVAKVPADVQAVYGLAAVDGPYDGRLSNGGGDLRLYGRLGELLLEMEYDDEAPWPAAADGAGHSLVLARPSYGERDPRAWSSSTLFGGSPGGGDPVATQSWRGVLINEWLAHTDDPQQDFIELYNATTQAVSLAGFWLSDDPSTNKFRIPEGTVIPAGGHLVWTQSQLGFALDAAGEFVVLRAPDGATVVDMVAFGPSANGVGSGRVPDGAPDWCELAALTPGAPNAGRRLRPVVINEVMYHPITEDDLDEFIELHNWSDQPVNVGGWRIRGGISFNIPTGIVIPAGGHLVIAADAARLRQRCSWLNTTNCVGNFAGRLSDRTDTIRLQMPEDLIATNAAGQWTTNRVYVMVNEVTYWDGGQWGRWSDGGGSSLELTDPRADNRRPAAWADSDESQTCGWVTIEHTGVLDHGHSSYSANELHLMALGAGEYDVDNVQVLNASGQNLITNGTFTTGAEGWTLRGSHQDSTWRADAGESGGGLRLIASWRGDPGVNRAGAKLTATLATGTVATLRARVRWRAGHPEVLLRLRGNWLEATGPLLTTQVFGTPGRPNSRRTTNSPPQIWNVTHRPILPATNQPVEVWAQVDDPDGFFMPRLVYRLDGAPVRSVVPMEPRRGGYFVGSIPPPGGTTAVTFYVEVEDAAAAGSYRRFPANAPANEGLIRWGETNLAGTFAHYRLWITEATRRIWTDRDKNSNHPLPGTFVYNADRVIYDMRCMYSGSPFHTRGFNGPTGSAWCDYSLEMPKDQRLLNATDFVLQMVSDDGTRLRQQVGYWAAEQLGVPYLHRRYHHLSVNGVRRTPLSEDSQQPAGDVVEEFYPNDDRGPLYKIEDWFEFQDDGLTFANVNATLGDFRTAGGVRKTARYRWNWRPRAIRGTANDFSQLFTLVDAVNATSPYPYEAVVPATLDVREWMRVFAFERVFRNYDSYGFQRGKNMYAYKPAQSPWQLLMWDIDFIFATSSTNEPLFGSENDPAMARLKSYPPFQRLFWAAVKELLDGPFREEVLGPQMQMRYSALVSNGATPSAYSSLLTFVRDRRAYVLQQLASVQSPFTVALPPIVSTNANFIELTGTAPVEADRITVNGVARTPEWLSMNQWRVYLPLAEGTNAMRIHAVDVRGSPITNAAVDRVIISGAATEPAVGNVVINEIMYQPVTSGAAFVELHNAATSTWYDLSRWVLRGVGLTIPDGTVLPPGGFAVFAANRAMFAQVYGAGVPVAAEYPGGLADEGETLALIRPGPTPAEDVIVDQVAYESRPPWPLEAAGLGASLQLRHPRLDRRRAGNWAATLGSTTATPAQTLVAMTNLWRYNTGGTNLGAGWIVPTYNDTGWSTGRALLYNDIAPMPAPTNTWLPLTNAAGDRIVTYYFRTPFVYTGNPADITLRMTTALDDGAIVYLNGTEALRIGMPDGPAAWTTLAARAVGHAVIEGPFDLPAELLVPGTNFVAVEVHQNATNSSDVAFGLALVAEPRSVAAATPGTTNAVLCSLTDVPPLWINELVVSNLTGHTDNAGQRDPWLELYNAHSNAIPLDGWALTDDPAVPLKWPFPAGSSVPGRGFLVVWLDGQPTQSVAGVPHTSFRIGGSTGVVALVWAGSNRVAVADHIRWSGVPADRAFGSWPDGDPIARKLLRTPTPAAPNDGTAPPLQLRINEYLADNVAAFADPADGQFEDWFELYNPTDDPMDLGGAYLTDDLSNPTKYRIPAGFSVPARGFLLVWADNEPSQNNLSVRPDLHVGFALSKSGEAIALYDADRRLVDSVVFGPQVTDVTEGRYPDGGPLVGRLPRPTPGAANAAPVTNTPPRLRPLPVQTVFRGAVLRLTFVADDADLPPQTLTYAVDGLPPLAQFDADTGELVWAVPAVGGVESIRLVARVTDSGTPPLSDEREVFVVVLPLPELSAAVPGSLPPGAAPPGFRFGTVPGRTYQIEYTDSLSPANWRPWSSLFVAEGETVEFYDPGVGRQRFYRVRDATAP